MGYPFYYAEWITHLCVLIYFLDIVCNIVYDSKIASSAMRNSGITQE